MEEWSSLPVRTSRRKKKWLFMGIALLLILVAAGGLIWRMQQPKSLLPHDLAQNVATFTPYFYFGNVPAGYSLDTAHISLDGDVLIMPLTNPGAPNMVLTEQPMPANLPDERLFQNGEKVENARGTATINSVEGRLLGVMVSQDHKILILLNTSSEAHKSDISLLLQKLRPIH